MRLLGQPDNLGRQLLAKKLVSKKLSIGTAVGVLSVSLILSGCGATSSGGEGSTNDGSTASSSSSPTGQQTVQPNDYVAAPPTAITPEPMINGRPPILGQIQTKNKVVFLTIDDGYYTDPRTAEVLAEYGIPVTPFLTNSAVNGDRYQYFADISRQNGQTIQNHTLTHPDLRTLGFDAQKAQICGTNEKYEKVFGTSPWMLRPPYGEINESGLRAAQECGIDYVVRWSTSMPKAELRYQVGNKLRPGDIILTHWSAEYHKWVRGLIKEVKRQGFKFGALQDYLPRR